MPSLKDLNEQRRDIKRESFDSFSRIDYVVNPNNRLTGSFSVFPQKFDFFNLNTFNPSETTANFHQRGASQNWRGSHAFKAGANYSYTSYRGSDRSSPVSVQRADGTRYQLIDFTGTGVLDRQQNEFSAFLQDKWILNKQFVFDLGLRYDRDHLGEENNFAPRLGLVFAATDRTVVRGGIGIFYDKIPLNIGGFEQYQSLVVTTFAANGVTVVDGPRVFRNITPDDLRNPYSLAWNLQVDHDLNRHLLLRLGYEDRSTRRDFTLEPIVSPSNANEGLLFLENSGRSRYRELQADARFRFQESRNIYLSYLRSAARGNLNAVFRN